MFHGWCSYIHLFEAYMWAHHFDQAFEILAELRNQRAPIGKLLYTDFYNKLRRTKTKHRKHALMVRQRGLRQH